MTLSSLSGANASANSRKEAYRYSAFISYSRALDAPLATALQSALQKFAKPWYRLRALRIFRDDASLSANPDLWASVQTALGDSEFLILLASRKSANSLWVNREVEYWLDTKPLEKILIAVTEDELQEDTVTHEIVWPEVQILPPALIGKYKQSPRYVDLRWAHSLNLSDMAASSNQLTLRNPQFLENVADLAATLHGRPKDEITGEEIRQHRRAIRLARTAVALLSALALIASFAAVVAFRQTKEARHQLDVATSRQLAAQAQLVSPTDPQLAALLSIVSYDVQDTGDARAGLARQVQRNRNIDTFLTTPGGNSAVKIGLDDQARSVVAVYQNGRVIRWDFDGHRKVIDRLLDGTGSYAVSNNGRLVAFSVNDGTAVQEVDSGKPLAFVPETFGRAVFSPDNAIIAVATRRNQPMNGNPPLLLWNIARNALISTSTDNAGYFPLGFSPDGRILAADAGTYADKINLALYDVATMKVVRFLRNGHDRGIFSIAFAPDGRHLVSGGHDAKIVFWDLQQENPISTIDAHADVNTLKFSADGKTLYSGDGARNITAWNVDRREPTQVLSGHTSGVNDISLSNDGRTLISASDDTKIGVWDLVGHDQLAIRALPFSARPIAFNPSGTKLAAADDQNHSLLIIDIAKSAVIARYPIGVLSSDWKSLYIGPGQRISGPFPPGSDIGRVATLQEVPSAISMDGTRLLVRSGDGSSKILNPSSGGLVPIRSITASSSIGHLAAFNREGTTLAFGDFDAIIMVDSESGEQTVKLPGHDPGGLVQGLAFNTDGSRLASLAEESAQTALGCAGCNIILWDMHRRTELAKLIGHTYAPTDVQFSPDSELLASSSPAEVILWSVDQRAPIAFLHASGSLTFSSKSGLLATQTPDPRLPNAHGDPKQIQIWDVDATSWRRRLCNIAGRSLTQQEWESYLPGRPYEPICG